MKNKPSKSSRSGQIADENCRISMVFPKKYRARIKELAAREQRYDTEWVRLKLIDIIENYPGTK